MSWNTCGGAAWCFHSPKPTPPPRTWVAQRARAILDGNAANVAAGVRRRATKTGLSKTKTQKGRRGRPPTSTNKARYLDYPTALASGWPIATGVIEGACRHLVKDRMDITGARWGLAGAEAILTLRALISNGDFDQYWTFHLAQEHRRVHASRYALGVIPTPA